MRDQASSQVPVPVPLQYRAFEIHIQVFDFWASMFDEKRRGSKIRLIEPEWDESGLIDDIHYQRYLSTPQPFDDFA